MTAIRAIMVCPPNVAAAGDPKAVRPPSSLPLVAGPFFYVLGCICETGLMLFTEYVIQNSVQEAARLVRTGQVSAADGTLTMSATDFKDKICEDVGIIIDCTGKVSVYVNSADDFAALTASMADPLAVGSQGSNGTPIHLSTAPAPHSRQPR